MEKNITSQTLSRLPIYFNYLVSLPEERKKGNISATAIAEALGLNDVQVRKDLASVSCGGRPKVGYMTSELIGDIGKFLGFENHDKVVVAGMGNFGRAMLEYNGFEAYGFDIICGFDCNKERVGKNVGGKPVRHIDELEDFCLTNDIRIGIITVPETAAQEVCDRMAEAGIKYILNFAAVHINAPKGVAVHNENISLTLAMLARCGA
ncbi:redox-sensing transcriptional repressor Rex [Ruminococcus flavefaciens]|uniref:redox-sensing transcriptional repressor Rex n=1 Tax=Ruminococcus flavefaciens TaxID=1265 RepID=UPI00048CEB1F|nr:redox-sensing transcriptional repressor Rex [Ruminococcus flavefaciens]